MVLVSFATGLLVSLHSFSMYGDVKSDGKGKPLSQLWTLAMLVMLARLEGGLWVVRMRGCKRAESEGMVMH